MNRGTATIRRPSRYERSFTMANQVAAILSGEDYQHLFSFLQILELMMRGKRVAHARVEDQDAGSADDVTVYQQVDSPLADRFYQIKYHVNQSGHYSTDSLIEHEPNKSSLLMKLFRSWKTLQANRPDRPIEIHLVSNWGWDSADKLKTCMCGQTNATHRELHPGNFWLEHRAAPR